MNIKAEAGLYSNAASGRCLYCPHPHGCTPNLVAARNPNRLHGAAFRLAMEVSISSSVVVVGPDTDAEPASVSAGSQLLLPLNSGSGSSQTVPLTAALCNPTGARAGSAIVPAVPAGWRAAAPPSLGRPCPHPTPQPLPPVQLLTAAIRNGNVGMVQDLLPQPSGLLGFGLLEAVCSGHRDILELLLDAAAGAGGGGSLLQPPPADAQGRTALHFAAANDDYSAAQLLLARGADVDVRLPEGSSLALTGGLPALAGNDTGGITSRGMRQQQLALCVPSAHLPCLQAVSRDGMTPVHYAAAAGHRALAELLQEQGAAPDAKAADGSTPLLLAAGAWLTCGAPAACVPLPAAACVPPAACVPLPAAPTDRTLQLLLLSSMLLLLLAAAIHRFSSPRMCAPPSPACLLPAEGGHTHCVESLLRRQADPNSRDDEGSSPLLAALAGGHRRAAEALLAAGAQPGGSAGQCDIHACIGYARLFDRLLVVLLLRTHPPLSFVFGQQW